MEPRVSQAVSVIFGCPEIQMSKLSGRKEWKKRKPSFYTGAWGSSPPFLSPVWGHAAPTKGLPNISQGNIRVRMGKPSPGSALCHHQKSFCLFHRSVVFVLPHDLFSQNLYFWNSSKNCGVVKRSPFWKAAAKTQPVPPGGSHSRVPGGDGFCSAPLPGRCRRSENPPARNHPRAAAERATGQRQAPSCCAAGHPVLQPVPPRGFLAGSLPPVGMEAASSSPPPSPTPRCSQRCHLPTSSPASHQHRTMVDDALLPRREERDRRRCPRSSAGRSARRCGHGTFRCPRRGSGPRLQLGAGSGAVTSFRRGVKKKKRY